MQHLRHKYLRSLHPTQTFQKANRRKSWFSITLVAIASLMGAKTAQAQGAFACQSVSVIP